MARALVLARHKLARLATEARSKAAWPRGHQDLGACGTSLSCPVGSQPHEAPLWVLQHPIDPGQPHAALLCFRSQVCSPSKPRSSSTGQRCKHPAAVPGFKTCWLSLRPMHRVRSGGETFIFISPSMHVFSYKHFRTPQRLHQQWVGSFWARST